MTRFDIEHSGYNLERLGNDETGYMLNPSEGPAVWFYGGLLTFKARKNDTKGLFSVSEWTMPENWYAPPHHHEDEAEAMYILEGNLTFTVSDATYHVTPGCFVFIPVNASHSIHVDSKMAKIITIISPGGFEHFFEELSVPAQAATFPINPDPSTLATLDDLIELGKKYGWRVAEVEMKKE